MVLSPPSVRLVEMCFPVRYEGDDPTTAPKQVKTSISNEQFSIFFFKRMYCSPRQQFIVDITVK